MRSPDKRYKRIDEVEAHNIKFGRATERRVAEMLAMTGCKNIKLTTAHGPDIIFDDEKGIERTCEVKSLCRDKNGKDSWFTTAVSENRKKDDYFATIFPNGDLHLESMSLHLKKTSPSGRRNFTKELYV